MNEKYLKLTQQFEKTVAAICQSPYEYNRFLTTAAHNYRLSFKNAVLAYAQGTDKDLLLTYEQWQRYGRVPKRHSKATLLIDTAAKERYLVTFAASKTVVDKRIHQHKELRYFSYTVTPETIAAIQSIFHSESNDLREMLYARVREQFENFFDDAYPAFENETDYLTKSVTNMLFSRFGEKMPYDNTLSPFGINPDNIEHIYQMVIDVFRAEYAELATLIPEEIEKQHIFTEDDDLPFDDVSTSEDTKQMLDYGRYRIDERSVFGNIFTIPIETDNDLLERLSQHGVVPKDEKTTVVLETDNGTWNKLIIPDRFGNKTNSIDFSEVLTQEELSVVQTVIRDAIEREQEKTDLIQSITEDDIALLQTLEPRKSVLNFTPSELAQTSVWNKWFANDLREKSPFYRAENGELA